MTPLSTYLRHTTRKRKFSAVDETPVDFEAILKSTLGEQTRFIGSFMNIQETKGNDILRGAARILGIEENGDVSIDALKNLSTRILREISRVKENKTKLEFEEWSLALIFKLINAGDVWSAESGIFFCFYCKKYLFGFLEFLLAIWGNANSVSSSLLRRRLWKTFSLF